MLCGQVEITKKKIPQCVTGGNLAVKHSMGLVGKSLAECLLIQNIPPQRTGSDYTQW